MSYPYISQLETGDREPALKTIRALAPVLDVPVDELAALVAGGEWAASGSTSYQSLPRSRTSAPRASKTPTASSAPSAAAPHYNRDKVLLSLERRLQGVPPLERISVLNELITQTLEEVRRADS